MTLLSKIRLLLRPVAPMPQMLDGLETLDRVHRLKLSLVRYGDGETSLMFPGLLPRRLHFQKHDPDLGAQLRAIFASDDRRVLRSYNNLFTQRDEVPIILDFERSRKNYSFTSSIHRPNDVGVLTGRAPAYRRWLKKIRARYHVDVLGESMCFFLSIYADAYRCGDLDRILSAYRRIFEGRRVVIVGPARPLHGASFKELVKNGVIESPETISFVEISDRDCFAERTQIMRQILKIPRVDAVLLQAGPTATVLAYELATRHGTTAYDVGSFNTSLERAHAVLGARF